MFNAEVSDHKELDEVPKRTSGQDESLHLPKKKDSYISQISDRFVKRKNKKDEHDSIILDKKLKLLNIEEVLTR